MPRKGKKKYNGDRNDQQPYARPIKERSNNHSFHQPQNPVSSANTSSASFGPPKGPREWAELSYGRIDTRNNIKVATASAASRATASAFILHPSQDPDGASLPTSRVVDEDKHVTRKRGRSSDEEDEACSKRPRVQEQDVWSRATAVILNNQHRSKATTTGRPKGQNQGRVLPNQQEWNGNMQDNHQLQQCFPMQQGWNANMKYHEQQPLLFQMRQELNRNMQQIHQQAQFSLNQQMEDTSLPSNHQQAVLFSDQPLEVQRNQSPNQTTERREPFRVPKKPKVPAFPEDARSLRQFCDQRGYYNNFGYYDEYGYCSATGHYYDDHGWICPWGYQPEGGRRHFDRDLFISRYGPPAESQSTSQSQMCNNYRQGKRCPERALGRCDYAHHPEAAVTKNRNCIQCRDFRTEEGCPLSDKQCTFIHVRPEDKCPFENFFTEDEDIYIPPPSANTIASLESASRSTVRLNPKHQSVLENAMGKSTYDDEAELAAIMAENYDALKVAEQKSSARDEQQWSDAAKMPHVDMSSERYAYICGQVEAVQNLAARYNPETQEWTLSDNQYEGKLWDDKVLEDDGGEASLSDEAFSSDDSTLPASIPWGFTSMSPFSQASTANTTPNASPGPKLAKINSATPKMAKEGLLCKAVDPKRSNEEWDEILSYFDIVEEKTLPFAEPKTRALEEQKMKVLKGLNMKALRLREKEMASDAASQGKKRGRDDGDDTSDSIPQKKQKIMDDAATGVNTKLLESDKVSPQPGGTKRSRDENDSDEVGGKKKQKMENGVDDTPSKPETDDSSLSNETTSESSPGTPEPLTTTCYILKSKPRRQVKVQPKYSPNTTISIGDGPVTLSEYEIYRTAYEEPNLSPWSQMTKEEVREMTMEQISNRDFVGDVPKDIQNEAELVFVQGQALRHELELDAVFDEGVSAEEFEYWKLAVDNPASSPWPEMTTKDIKKMLKADFKRRRLSEGATAEKKKEVLEYFNLGFRSTKIGTRISPPPYRCESN